MRVLSIGSDRNLFDKNSAVYARHIKYAKAVGELYVIVFSVGKQKRPPAEGGLHIYATNSKSRWWYGLDALRVARALPKPEVISAQDPFEIGLVAWLAAWILRTPLHVQVHTDFFSPTYVRHSRLNALRVRIAGFVLKRAVHIRVVSPRIKRQMEERYHPKAEVSVLPIFVDVQKFMRVRHESHPRFEKSLLFVGRLEPEKRADIAIRTLARVRSLGVNAGLTILGEGSLRKQLQALAQREGVKDRVAFVGRQDPLPHYAHADVVLVPSSYEGYGMVIVEALASGVPVVATDVGVAQEAGAIIAPHGTDNFAGEVCALFARPELPKGRLLEYPYKNEEEYVNAWAADIRASIKSR